MKKMKLKLIVKMGRGDKLKYNYDVDYNDDECEDIYKGEGNEDWTRR